MGVNQALLLSGFLESETTSMALYADGLNSALRKYAPGKFIYSEFTPKMLLPKWILNKWGMRFARFFLYPLQAPHIDGAITHLLDHGYAHLFYTYKSKKTVVTVTDLIPVLWWKGRLLVQTKKGMPLTVLYFLHALKRASHIIAISSNTKKDLIELIGCDPSKISVVPLGVDDIFKPYDKNEKQIARRRLFGYSDQSIILITGSQFYKNHETVLKTLSFLIANGLDNVILVKTGSVDANWLSLIKKYKLEKKVINVGFIPREQMPQLYNSVDLLFFPSIYEGFGWPPLEAMACGIPAVTSNVASLPEIMGPIDTMCEPFDYIGFAEKITSLLNSEDYYQSVIRQGLYQSSKFTWEKIAKKTIEVYNLVDSKNNN